MAETAEYKSLLTTLLGPLADSGFAQGSLLLLAIAGGLTGNFGVAGFAGVLLAGRLAEGTINEGQRPLLKAHDSKAIAFEDDEAEEPEPVPASTPSTTPASSAIPAPASTGSTTATPIQQRREPRSADWSKGSIERFRSKVPTMGFLVDNLDDMPAEADALAYEYCGRFDNTKKKDGVPYLTWYVFGLDETSPDWAIAADWAEGFLIELATPRRVSPYAPADLAADW